MRLMLILFIVFAFLLLEIGFFVNLCIIFFFEMFVLAALLMHVAASEVGALKTATERTKRLNEEGGAKGRRHSCCCVNTRYCAPRARGRRCKTGSCARRCRQASEQLCRQRAQEERHLRTAIVPPARTHRPPTARTTRTFTPCTHAIYSFFSALRPLAPAIPLLARTTRTFTPCTHAIYSFFSSSLSSCVLCCALLSFSSGIT